MVSESLVKYLREVESTRSQPTHQTYKFILTPFDQWLQKRGKTIDTFENTDLVDYLKARSDLSKYTRKQILNKIKTYVRRQMNEIDYGVNSDEMRVSMNRKNSLMRILDLRMLSFLKGSDGVEKKKSLSVEELKMLLDYATPTDKRHIFLLAYFGLRVSEYLSVSVDYVGKRIKFTRAKTYKVEWLDFTPYVGELLRKTDIKCLQEKELNHRLYKYDCLGYRVRPHMFRHTFITQMRKSIWGRVRDPGYVLKALSGHSLGGDMTDFYTDVEDFRVECREAMTSYHYMREVRT